MSDDENVLEEDGGEPNRRVRQNMQYEIHIRNSFAEYSAYRATLLAHQNGDDGGNDDNVDEGGADENGDEGGDDENGDEGVDDEDAPVGFFALYDPRTAILLTRLATEFPDEYVRGSENRNEELVYHREYDPDGGYSSEHFLVILFASVFSAVPICPMQRLEIF